MSEVITNSLIFREIEKMYDEKTQDMSFVKPTKEVLVTSEYGIFKLNNSIEFENSVGNSSSYELRMRTYSIENDSELTAILRDESKKDSFYGALVIIDGQPYNPLSFIYLNRNISIDKETTMITYHRENDTVNSDIVQNVFNSVGKIDISDIVIERNCKETKEVHMTAYAPRNLEDIGLDIHLDTIHVPIKKDMDKKDIAMIVMSRDMLLNTRVDSTEESSVNLLGDNWGVEHSVIYNGSVLPTYGFWKYVNGRMTKMITATDHPNVSENGESYCTGINNHTSIKGISELCYGNLTSPLNKNIYHNNTLSVAKGYIKFFMENVYGY